ncbi:MAG: hypothetical protein ACLTBV_31845 [Enterocloster bolteae]
MPYKAEMWDSMESIWLACREDPACECRVMPLPYYEYDKARGGWRQCYDGERFPKEVPVTDYRQYSLNPPARIWPISIIHMMTVIMLQALTRRIILQSLRNMWGSWSTFHIM